jgi:hypothetical protein
MPKTIFFVFIAICPVLVFGQNQGVGTIQESTYPFDY